MIKRPFMLLRNCTTSLFRKGSIITFTFQKCLWIIKTNVLWVFWRPIITTIYCCTVGINEMICDFQNKYTLKEKPVKTLFIHTFYSSKVYSCNVCCLIYHLKFIFRCKDVIIIWLVCDINVRLNVALFCHLTLGSHGW